MNAACSPLVAKILSARPDAYRALVVSHGTSSEVQTLFSGVKAADLLNAPIRSQSAADAMLAGLWLWHDALNESHTISQGLEDATGSFWHAIMHRREGDFFNSKYWYGRCRKHPAMGVVAERAGEAWEPNTFVGRVAQVHDRPEHPDHNAVVRLQRIEWESLFDHCVATAIG